ncbi:hypothetical protein EDD99_5567 [Streptomyces sp. 846.5]|nr:hypothetical protein [Streptomyces sp. 846.5]TDT97434.1 hypothetical protein EDD99_5567 [Streptomyces sp. 846.5]
MNAQPPAPRASTGTRLPRPQGRVVLAVVATTALAVLGLTRLAQSSSGSDPGLAALTIKPPTGVTVVYRNSGAEVLSNGSMILPLDGYNAYSDPAEERLVFEAATRVEQACMRAKGFALPTGYGGKYLPVLPPPLVFYGVASMADARQFGYRVPDRATAATAQVSASVMAAFAGDAAHPGGCAGQAYSHLAVAQAADAYATQQGLFSQALTAVRKDAGLRAADAAWSTCMKRSGLTYPDPLAPANDMTLLGRGLPTPKGAALPPPSTAEKHVAMTDVTCKDKVHYLATYADVLAAAQRRIIKENSALLHHVLAEWNDVLQRSNSVLSTRTN